MKKTNKKNIEEFIRVDHAGERGAIKIYEGQLLALNTVCKDEKLKETIKTMKLHEKEHLDFFEQEIKKEILILQNSYHCGIFRNWIRFWINLLGKKAAMLCTASVEEVIDEHYQNQIDQINNDEKKLKEKIIKFREDELNHKDIAYEEGATKNGIYSVLDKVIKVGSKVAISISEKFNYGSNSTSQYK